MEDMSITKRILLYIEDNLENELSLEKIAKELNYSKFYIARIFKDNTGITLYKYIQGRRLDEAARKLVETKQLIVDIAFEAGSLYNRGKHKILFFKGETHIKTPVDLEKMKSQSYPPFQNAYVFLWIDLKIIT